MRAIKEWARVLGVAREVAEDAGDERLFTSVQLGAAAAIPSAVASAWLGKFFRWGYALRAGKVPTGGRWAFQWRLTKWGMNMKIGPEAKGRFSAFKTVAVAANPKKKRKED